MLPSPAAVLAAHAQVAGLGKAVGLGVELRVRDREEVPDRCRGHLLQGIGGRLTRLPHEAEHDVRGGCEGNHSLRVRNIWYVSDRQQSESDLLKGIFSREVER